MAPDMLHNRGGAAGNVNGGGQGAASEGGGPGEGGTGGAGEEVTCEVARLVVRISVTLARATLRFS